MDRYNNTNNEFAYGQNLNLRNEKKANSRIESLFDRPHLVAGTKPMNPAKQARLDALVEFEWFSGNGDHTMPAAIPLTTAAERSRTEKSITRSTLTELCVVLADGTDPLEVYHNLSDNDILQLGASYLYAAGQLYLEPVVYQIASGGSNTSGTPGQQLLVNSVRANAPAALENVIPEMELGMGVAFSHLVTCSVDDKLYLLLFFHWPDPSEYMLFLGVRVRTSLPTGVTPDSLSHVSRTSILSATHDDTLGVALAECKVSFLHYGYMPFAQ